MPNRITLKVHPRIPSLAVVEESVVVPHEVFMKPKVLSSTGLEVEVFKAMESGMEILLERDNIKRDWHSIKIEEGGFVAPIWILAYFFAGNEDARKTLHIPWVNTTSYLKKEEGIAYVHHPIHPITLARAGIPSTQKEYQLVIPVKDFPSGRIPLNELSNYPQTIESVFLNNVDWFVNDFLEKAKFVKSTRHQYPTNPYEACFFAYDDHRPPFGAGFDFGGANSGDINFGIACCDTVHYNGYAKIQLNNRFFQRIMRFGNL